MVIVKDKKYRIKGSSKYFKEKYGTANPVIRIEDTDKNVFGGSWMIQYGNPTCLLYAMRAGTSELPIAGEVYYGKVYLKSGAGLGELVHETELEEI